MSSVISKPLNTRWIARFMDVALLAAQWSKDPSTKVGAVVVSTERHIVGVGYNGFPAALPDLPELLQDREAKLKRVVHAEEAALDTAGRRAEGGALFSTLYVCPRCVPRIIQAKIQVVVVPPIPEQRIAEGWGEGADILRAAGIDVFTYA